MSAADKWDRCGICGAEMYQNRLDMERWYHRHGAPWCYPDDITRTEVATTREEFVRSSTAILASDDEVAHHAVATSARIATVSAIADVMAERQRQDEKWGEQNHPNVDPALIERHATPAQMAEAYGVLRAEVARDRCELAAAGRGCTWAHILVEELAEAIEAATFYDEAVHTGSSWITEGLRLALRDELIQVAAVAVQWAEKVEGTRP